MRGNPIKEWVIFSALWLLLLIPVIRLTGTKRSTADTTPAEIETQAVRSVEATLVLKYTGKPSLFCISQNRKALFKEKKPPEGGTERDITLVIEENSAELLLQAEWPDEEEHVFEIELIIEGEEEQETHCWARKELDEVVSFSWQAGETINAER